jgi:deoxycytidine triphosphate deaminase
VYTIIETNGGLPNVLTRKAITQAVECGDIVIEPFHPENLSPNSIDVTLNENLLTYTLEGGCLDMKKEKPHRTSNYSKRRHGFTTRNSIYWND